jgi:hypothetical protein
MLRKIRNNVKNVGRRESSLLDFVREVKETKDIKVKSNTQETNKRKLREKNSLVNVQTGFNGHLRDALLTRSSKMFQEDKENINGKLLRNNSANSNSITNYFKPLESQISQTRVVRPLPKVYKVDFFDEYNKKSVKMNQFDEKELDFTKSKILPQVKYMKVDNDVMTDSEQLKDAFTMMRDNLKETIKLIQENKDYLQKNLSRKIKFKK